MPGAVGKESKMEKKRKAKRKNVATAVQVSGFEVGGMFTLQEAYAKYQTSALNGRNAAKVEAFVRDRSVNGAQRLNVELNSSFVESSHNAAQSSTEKARWHQESCITEDGSGNDNPDGIQFLESSFLERRASGNGLPKCVSQDDADKTEAKRKRVEDGENGECSVEQLAIKAQKLSEEARVWQYVCKRSVLVSPPQRAQLPDKKDKVWGNQKYSEMM